MMRRGPSRFELKETMKRLKLPPSLLTIREHTFADHRQLIDVTIPSSLRSIEHHAFFYCSSLAMSERFEAA
jgi:hypothetical protein